MFEILLPESYKSRTLRDICPLLYNLQDHDWDSFGYGISSGEDEKKERSPISAGIPTSHGSIIFWRIGYDEEKLLPAVLEYANARVSKEKYEELESSGDLAEGTLTEDVRKELGKGLEEKVLQFVSYLQYDLLVAIPASSLSEETEDVAGHIKKEIKKLKGILETFNSVRSLKTKKASRLFDDVELHVWDLQYGDRDSVLGTIEGFEEPDDIIEAWDNLSGDMEDEEEETSLVLTLRSDVDVKTTVKSLEQQISGELKTIEGSFEPRPAFITLVG
jgi:hypothetical protein